MKEAIDLYTKLLIGTFSFIGPSFTLLIPIFYKAIERSRTAHENVLRNLIVVTIASIDSTRNPGAAIAELNKNSEKLIKQNRREINLLNPKRQVKRIFRGLFVSIGFVLIYYIFLPVQYLDDRQIIGWICLGISGLSYSFCIWILWQILCTIIQVKIEEGKKNKEIL